MRYTILLFLAFIPFFSAYGQKKGDELGYAFVSRGPVSQKDLVVILSTCKSGTKKSPRLRVDCLGYLSSINAADPEADVRSVSQLAAYVESLTEVDCPSGRGKLTRVMLPSGRVDNLWQRDFRRGERCLANANTNSYVLSLACGNPILSPKALPFETPKREKVAVIQQQKQLDSVFVLSDKDTIRVSFTDKSNRKDLTVVDTATLSLSSTLIRFRVIKDTLHKPLLVANVTMPVVEKKRRWVKPAVLGFLTGVGVGVLICELSHKKDKVVYIRNGGPVNPPNGVLQPNLAGVSSTGVSMQIRFP